MKSIFLSFLVLACAGAAQAQSQPGVSLAEIAPTEQAAKMKGINIGLEYSNITDLKLKFSYKKNGSTYEETQTAGTHLGFLGLTAGFTDKQAINSVIGVAVSGTISKGINGSEVPSKIVLYKGQGDLTLALSDMFSVLGGANVSYFSGANENGNKYEPGIGLQASMKANTRSGVAISAGYQILGATVKLDASNNGLQSDTKTDVLFSGFVTQLSYMF